MTVPEISDAQRRLLAAVAERLPGGQVCELYLFAPIRQGGVETGLAVIAAGEPTEAEAAIEPAGPTDAVEAPDVPVCTPEDADVVRAAVLAAEAAAESSEDAAESADAGIQIDLGAAADDAAANDVSTGDVRADGETVAAVAVDDAPACDPTDAAARGTDDVVSDTKDANGTNNAAGDDVLVAADEPIAEESAAPARYTVYTARYRLQLKGPDRGKWAMELVAEADAPLLTVDAVVRGVQRRAGELAEVERLTGPDLARLLGEAS